MDFKQTPICKRTRLQENLFIKKYYEEKKKAHSGDGSDKKGNSGVKDVDVVIVDENVDGDHQNCGSDDFDEGENFGNTKNRELRKGVKRSRKGDEVENYSKDSGKKMQKVTEMKKGKNVGPVGCDLKQNRGVKNGIRGGNCVVDDDGVGYVFEEGTRRTLYSKLKRGLDKRGNKNDTGGQNSDDDIVVLGEEVVSNGNSSRVPSSLGSGLNSGCVRVKNFEHVDADEVVSSSLRDNATGTNDGVSRRGQSGSGSSKMGKDTHRTTVYVSSSEEYTESGKSDGSLDSGESLDSADSEESESKLSYEVDTNPSDDDDFRVDESLRSQTNDDSSCFNHDNREEKEEKNDDSHIAKENSLEKKVGKDSVIFIEDEEEEEEEEEDYDDEEDEDEDYDDDDDDYDYDRRITVKRNVAGKVEGNNKNVKPGKTKQKEKKIIEGGLKRRRAYGLDVLIDCNYKDNTENKSIAERIRPRLVSKSRKKKLKLGKYSCPLTIADDDKSESSSDSEDASDEFENKDDDDKSESSSDSEDISDEYEKKDEECKKEVRKRKKRRRFASNCLDFIKILSDSLWEKEDLLKADIDSFEVATKQKTLSLKFRFEDENPALPEKATWKKEIDALFDEMELVLRAGEISSTDPSVVENDDVISSESETSPAECCRTGKHDLILDEPIGLRCRYCSFVQLEMKYIFPPFAKDPFKRWEKKDHSESECSFLDRLQFQNSSKDHFRAVNAESTVWDIIPGMKERMYPHQRQGFEFIWKNLAGGISIKKLIRPLADEGNGCIISHAPGTGKTCLAIMFLLSFMELYPTCKPVIIAPRSMLLTWEEEFQKWNVDIPFHNVNKPELSGREHKTAASILGQLGKVRRTRNYIRMLKLYSWMKDRSVLAMSYRMFEKLAGKNVKEGENDQMRKVLLELPGILVLDEGHTPRNDQSLIWKALSEVKTKRRIILSGTPFQNNFTELFNTLCLVNPKFADHIPSQRRRGRGRRSAQKSNIAKGIWDFLTSTISKNVDDGIEELRHMIDPFVHVYKGGILQNKLPGLKDSLLVLRPTAWQKYLLNLIKHKPGVAGFRRTHLVSLISIHPSLVDDHEEFSNCGSDLKRLESDPDAGVKTKFVIELIRLSESLHEKVLVFSEYIEPLTFIMKQLKSKFEWCEGREVLYMDGSRHEKQRQASISSLNDPTSEVRVLLASTKACSEGINLVGASRVILLDVVWNPSVERQAISRAYRLGQEKVVHVYHLITAETVEVEKFACQTEKDRLSKLVFSSTDSNTRQTVDPPADLEDKILELMVQHKNLQNIFERILQRPKGSHFDLD